MKVCMYQGLVVAVLTRNEHCPPHVHVGTDKWDARFEFSFWHDGVRLWDVVPARKQPTVALLEAVRQIIKQPANLRRAREVWWNSLQRVCLVNQRWDAAAGEVVAITDRRLGARLIQAAQFDALAYKTVLQLAGRASPVEIAL